MMISSPEHDRKIGIGLYYTPTEGTGGLIKQEPNDFIVQEILEDGTVCSLEPEKQDLGEDFNEYLHFTLVKEDWNLDIILKNLSRKIGKSKKRFNFAGNKDKKAITSQRISVWHTSHKVLSPVEMKGCRIGDFSYELKGIDLGDLWGNKFKLKIKKGENNDSFSEINLKANLDFLKNKKLIPNFFGNQRFGNRLNNHEVGKKIIKKDFEGALKIFLAESGPETNIESIEARKQLQENWGDFKTALEAFPVQMRFERSVLSHLAIHPNDYVNAFKKLSKFTYKLFTHAYQSYLFNILLTNRIQNEQSLEGEGPLIGYASENLFTEAKDLLDSEGITQEELRNTSFLESSVRGNMRKWALEVKNLHYLYNSDEIQLDFELQKGGYATVFLREIMKI